MKHLLSILILISLISTSNAGIFDVFKGDETFCMDKIIDEAGAVAPIAATVCVNPTPSKSCMKRMEKEWKDKFPNGLGSMWISAAQICQNKPRE